VKKIYSIAVEVNAKIYFVASGTKREMLWHRKKYHIELCCCWLIPLLIIAGMCDASGKLMNGERRNFRVAQLTTSKLDSN